MYISTFVCLYRAATGSASLRPYGLARYTSLPYASPQPIWLWYYYWAYRTVAVINFSGSAGGASTIRLLKKIRIDTIYKN
jgi:hypothetical protein